MSETRRRRALVSVFDKTGVVDFCRGISALGFEIVSTGGTASRLNAAGMAVMNGLKLVTRAVSLGDAESLIQHPASMTHSTYSAEERAAHGISDGLMRLSVGLEEVGDILADLDQALGGSFVASNSNGQAAAG